MMDITRYRADAHAERMALKSGESPEWELL